MGERDKRVSPEDLAGMASLKHWGARPEDAQSRLGTKNAIVDCGWGRLIFGQTFDDLGELAESLREETEVAARFGEEWRRYASKTPRFLPRLLSGNRPGMGAT